MPAHKLAEGRVIRPNTEPIRPKMHEGKQSAQKLLERRAYSPMIPQKRSVKGSHLAAGLSSSPGLGDVGLAVPLPHMVPLGGERSLWFVSPVVPSSVSLTLDGWPKRPGALCCLRKKEMSC